MRVPSCLALFFCLLASSAAMAVSVEGTVVRDDSGAVLVSAEVQVARAGDAYLAAHLETDREGQFRAEDLPAGEYSVTIAKPGYLSTTMAVSDDGAPLRVRLIRTASIAGRVLTSSGEPLERAQVYLMERTKAGNLQRVRLGSAYASTKSDGAYRLHSLPPGNYVLAMSRQSSEGSAGTLYPDPAKPRLFALKGGEEIRDCDFTADIEASFAVAGKVEAPPPSAPPEPPAAGAPPKPPLAYSVGLAPAAQPGILMAWMRTEADGSFRFPSVPWGEYEVFGAGPVIGFSGMGSVLAREGELVFGRDRIRVSGAVEGFRISLAGARSAVVRLEAAKQGRTGCPASLDLRLTSVEAWGAELTQTITLPFGEARTVENLAPARYEVALARASDECGLASSLVLDLREGSPKEPFVVTAGGRGSVAGSIVGAMAGVPLEVVLLPLGGTASPEIRLGRVAADHAFRFAGLPPGRYGLTVRAASNEAAAPMLADRDSLVEVDVLGGTVEILLNAPTAAPALEVKP